MSTVRKVRIIAAWTLVGVGAVVALHAALVGELGTAWWAAAFALIGVLTWRVVRLEAIVEVHNATIAGLVVTVADLRRRTAGADAITDLMISNLVDEAERSR